MLFRAIFINHYRRNGVVSFLAKRDHDTELDTAHICGSNGYELFITSFYFLFYFLIDGNAWKGATFCISCTPSRITILDKG